MLHHSLEAAITADDCSAVVLLTQRAQPTAPSILVVHTPRRAAGSDAAAHAARGAIITPGAQRPASAEAPAARPAALAAPHASAASAVSLVTYDVTTVRRNARQAPHAAAPSPAQPTSEAEPSILASHAEPAAPSAERPAADLAAARAAVVGLLSRISPALGLAASDSPDIPLMSAGLTSQDTPELACWLAEAAGLPQLPETVLFQYPTPSLLTELLVELRAENKTARGAVGPRTSRRGGTLPPSRVPAAGPSRLAATPRPRIGGLCGRWPLSPSAAALTALGAAGGNAVAGVPIERWVVTAELLARSRAVQHLASLQGAALFDNQAFGISPAEAAFMDPQQRLLLEIGTAAFASAGWPRHALRGSDASVHVAISNADYAHMLTYGGSPSVYAATGGAPSVAAGRLSFTLGLHGACESIDTACSSALVALHAAVRGLFLDDCRAALAAAVSLVLTPHVSASYARAGMLSPAGRCRVFDASADGYVRGEGVGGLVLLPVLPTRSARGPAAVAPEDWGVGARPHAGDAAAVHAGDLFSRGRSRGMFRGMSGDMSEDMSGDMSGNMSGDMSTAAQAEEPTDAVVASVAVMHDGVSASLTAPSGAAQSMLIRLALARAGAASGTTLVAIEAHGTGTALGDPTEARALAESLAGQEAAPAGGTLGAPASSHASVGSIKANLGHLEPAAGLVGLCALATSLSASRAPPNAQLRVLSPHLHDSFAGRGAVLRALVAPAAIGHAALQAHTNTGGVSSFGYSGTIAHAILHAPRSARPSPLPGLRPSAPALHRRLFEWHAPPHPLLQHRPPSAQSTVAIFRTPAAGPLRALAAGHALRGEGTVFPGAGYLEMARAMCEGVVNRLPGLPDERGWGSEREGLVHSEGARPAGPGPSLYVELRRVHFLRPLLLHDLDGLWVACQLEPASCHFDIHSATDDNEEADRADHCAGDALAAAKAPRQAALLSAREAAADVIDVPKMYRALGQTGLDYGRRYRTLAAAWASAEQGLAFGALRKRTDMEGTQLHPADVDGALQVRTPAARRVSLVLWTTHRSVQPPSDSCGASPVDCVSTLLCPAAATFPVAVNPEVGLSRLLHPVAHSTLRSLSHPAPRPPACPRLGLFSFLPLLRR